MLGRIATLLAFSQLRAPFMPKSRFVTKCSRELLVFTVGHFCILSKTDRAAELGKFSVEEYYSSTEFILV